MLMITAAPLTIQYSCELTSCLRMSTDFSGCNVCCKSDPGRACSEENVTTYVAILFIFICITTIVTCTIILSYIYSGCGPSVEK